MYIDIKTNLIYFKKFETPKFLCELQIKIDIMIKRHKQLLTVHF